MVFVPVPAGTFEEVSMFGVRLSPDGKLGLCAKTSSLSLLSLALLRLRHGSWQIGYNLSKDCLSLNVIRPSDAVIKGRKLPVLVSTFGGGIVQGSGPDRRFNIPGGWDPSLQARELDEI